MCLAIPSIIVSDFYANRSRFIVDMWFKFFSLPLQVFRPYFVVFLALGMFYFLRNSVQTFAKHKFSAILFFFRFANHGLLRIVHGWQNENNKMAENFDWLLNHGLFVIVHGWQNENNKMAENFCFASVCTEFRKNRTCQEPKRLQNRV